MVIFNIVWFKKEKTRYNENRKRHLEYFFMIAETGCMKNPKNYNKKLTQLTGMEKVEAIA